MALRLTKKLWKRTSRLIWGQGIRIWWKNLDQAPLGASSGQDLWENLGSMAIWVSILTNFGSLSSNLTILFGSGKPKN
jgi:hypothetical protein